MNAIFMAKTFLIMKKLILHNRLIRIEKTILERNKLPDKGRSEENKAALKLLQRRTQQ